MLARLTLRKLKTKMSDFNGPVIILTLEHGKTDQIKCIASQSRAVNALATTGSVSLKQLANCADAGGSKDL